MPIGRHPLWCSTDRLDGLRRSKRLAASIVRFSLEPAVNQIAIPINRPREGTPFPVDSHVGAHPILGRSSLSTARGFATAQR